uniref:Uncharacterized protein n=1 Tax=Fagus sylvatica TaxID=28930 RepID=A0A2N9HGL0_FAGSY
MVEVEVGCARGCEREVFGDMWVAIGAGTVTARARSGDVEAGLACVAIGFARGLLNGMVGYSVMAESKRERSREALEERERKWGEKKEREPVTVIKWDHMN